MKTRNFSQYQGPSTFKTTLVVYCENVECVKMQILVKRIILHRLIGKKTLLKSKL